MNIEVELRSFISKERYEELINFFKQEGTFINEDYQETYYFDCEEDLRIQRNNTGSKIWLKKGKIHDDAREEIEVKFQRDQFEMLEQLFLAMCLDVEIKWFRNRHRFEWEGVKVTVDYTKGYGYIVELEQMANEENKEQVLVLLKEKFAKLGITITPKEAFNERYLHYKENWKSLVLE